MFINDSVSIIFFNIFNNRYYYFAPFIKYNGQKLPSLWYPYYQKNFIETAVMYVFLYIDY